MLSLLCVGVDGGGEGEWNDEMDSAQDRSFPSSHLLPSPNFVHHEHTHMGNRFFFISEEI